MKRLLVAFCFFILCSPLFSLTYTQGNNGDYSIPTSGTIDLGSANITTTGTITGKAKFAKMRLSNDQAITGDGNYYEVSLNTVVSDSNSWCNIAGSSITPTTAGWYMVTAKVFLSGLGDGKYFIADIRVNNVGVHRMFQNVNGASLDCGGNGSALIYLDGNDYVELFVNHNHGSNRNVYGTTSGGEVGEAVLSVVLISAD